MAVLFISVAASAQYSNLKSAEALKLRLDSMESNYWNTSDEMWEPGTYHYDYNASGQLILFYETWMDDSSGEVVADERNEYSYNEDGSMAEYQILEWNEGAGVWEK